MLFALRVVCSMNYHILEIPNKQKRKVGFEQNYPFFLFILARLFLCFIIFGAVYDLCMCDSCFLNFFFFWFVLFYRSKWIINSKMHCELAGKVRVHVEFM